MNLVKRFERALGWIDRNTLYDTGIAVTSRSKEPYPEVSGYYIPTLLNWNEIERARAYGSWLASCQNQDGSWSDPTGKFACVFDTGQVLKGFIALSDLDQNEKWHIPLRRGCDWIIGHIQSSGRLTPPDEMIWAGAVPLAVLLYSLEAVKRAGVLLGESCYVELADKAIGYFLKQKDLTAFTHLSHFHAYVLEALTDLGHHDRAAEGMALVARLQRSNGAVPAFPNVKWVCSTGLFQYAITWYKLGDHKRGNLAFSYAAKLQNRSGGWYGSYGFFKKYFPWAEISWAVKYFLDAFHWKLRTSFEDMASIFSEHIDPQDGRYILIRDAILNAKPNTVLDAGCGKGRYLRNLLKDCPEVKLHGSDLAMAVMETIPGQVITAQGSLMSLPYHDASFDMVYSVEALEHAVHVDGAIRELLRVLKPGGCLIIIDKNREHLGRLKLPEWEQWFGTQDLLCKLEAQGTKVSAQENIPYEGRSDGLFTAWVARKSILGG